MIGKGDRGLADGPASQGKTSAIASMTRFVCFVYEKYTNVTIRGLARSIAAPPWDS